MILDNKYQKYLIMIFNIYLDTHHINNLLIILLITINNFN